MGRLAFNITLYLMWMERNIRIFQGKNRLKDMLVREVENYIVAKVCSWSVKRSYRNWVLCKEWGLSERILEV